MPRSFVELITVGIEAVTGTVETLVETIGCPWALVVVIKTAIAAAVLVERTRLPCALVELTITGTGPTNGDGVEKTGFPSAIPEVGNTGEAAAKAVETMTLPCASLNVVGIGTRTVGKILGDSASGDALAAPIDTD